MILLGVTLELLILPSISRAITKCKRCILAVLVVLGSPFTIIRVPAGKLEIPWVKDLRIRGVEYKSRCPPSLRV